MVPISQRLVKANSNQHTEINGASLKRIFHQKIIYIRPTEDLTDLYSDENSFVDLCNEPRDCFTRNSFVDLCNTSPSSLVNFPNQLNNISENILEAENVGLIYQTESSELTLKDIISNLQMAINKEKYTNFNVYR